MKNPLVFRRIEVTATDFNNSAIGRSSRRTRTGAAVIEFAVIGPLLVLLILGVIEFGRMVMVQQILTNASREGARRAESRRSPGLDGRCHVIA